MTTLIVEELKTTLSQAFTFTDTTDVKRNQIGAIRPLIYMHNAPAGVFTISLKSGAATLVSKTFTSAEIQSDLSTVDVYAYIWKAIVFTNKIQLETGTYTIELSSSGYTFSDSSFIGWVKEYINRTVAPTSTITDDLDNPHSFQLMIITEVK